MSQIARPLPEASRWSKAYWEHCKNHELHIQQCSDCQKKIMYPKVFCPSCLSEDLTWIRTKGKGTIYSYTVVENNPPSYFVGKLPFIIAIIQLDEGVRMMTNIVDSNIDDIKCDAPVEVVFNDITDEITLPNFKIIT